MSFALLFWILMLIWLVFGFAWWRGMTGTWGPYGGGFLLFVLFLLLGWKIFGAPLHG